MKNLKEMTKEDLENLKKEIDKEIINRNENNKEYTFEFEATNDPRKGTPYVAKLVWNVEENKVDRVFCNNMNKTYGKKEVTVSGKYTAKEGEIIEIRYGGSWKNDYRHWYLIVDGKEINVADIDNSKKKAEVTEYLKGNINFDEFVQAKQKEIEIENKRMEEVSKQNWITKGVIE
jgi:hypothetical protein